VTEGQRPGQAEGWQADPHGRHELRFFDGHRWTPYVRDGEVNGLDEPGGPESGAGTPALGGGLLAERVLVVERRVDHGGRRADRVVRRADGSHAALLRPAAAGVHKPGLRSLVTREQAKGDALELIDEGERAVLSLLRPPGAPKGTVVVRDPAGRDTGRIAPQLRSGTTTFALLGPSSALLGELRAESWEAWELRVEDGHGAEVATITRDWDGLDRSSFPSTDHYVVRISQPVPEPRRTLVVACALSLEVAVRPDLLGA
jgi:hypothetical protein